MTKIIGKTEKIINHGTIIQLLLITEDGHLETVNFDHRMFQHFYEANAPLKDKTIAFDPETDTIEVLE